jgi:hypothetical protein
MPKEYLEDGCKWCGSQEWDDDCTDVDHARDCVVVLMRNLVTRWASDYHCCPTSKHHSGHCGDCPLARAQVFLSGVAD